MANVERYQELKSRIEDAKRRQSEAKGSLIEIKERLEKSFDCKTLKTAKEKLKTLSGQLETAEIEADTLMDKIEKALTDAQLD